MKDINIREVAKVIGHHFWNCKDDDIAIQCGMDCAKELNKEGLIYINKGKMETKKVKLKPICDSEVKGIICLESETQFGFRKNGNDLRPSSCLWIDKQDFNKLYEIIIAKELYNSQFI